MDKASSGLLSGFLIWVLPGHDLAYTGSCELLLLDGTVEEARFSSVPGTVWYAFYTGLLQLQLAAYDEEEECSLWIVLLHLHR